LSPAFCILVIHPEETGHEKAAPANQMASITYEQIHKLAT
jgi:hypothetical protein